MVITSGKPSGFCAGADLGDMASGMLAGGGDQVKASTATASNGACALETSGKPGRGHQRPGPGGGLEFTLACATIASSRTTRKSSRASGSEIKVGLFPAGGGTQRLTRLIGVQNALMQMA